ncbi:hypothetical protein ABIF90_007323 [Bradyrhizobium japonicum]
MRITHSRADEPRGFMIFVTASRLGRCCDGTGKVRMSNPICRSLRCIWGMSRSFRLPINCAGFRSWLLRLPSARDALRPPHHWRCAMRSQRPNELGKSIERFFREYLPTLRGPADTPHATTGMPSFCSCVLLRRKQQRLSRISTSSISPPGRSMTSWPFLRPSVTMASPPAMRGWRRCIHLLAFSQPNSRPI